jgi:hypothetical protein
VKKINIKSLFLKAYNAVKQTFKKMSYFFLVTKTEFCDTLDRIQEQRTTVTIPVRWRQILTIIEDEAENEAEEPAINYDLEDGEIYESTKTKNSLAAVNFMSNFEF